MLVVVKGVVVVVVAVVVEAVIVVIFITSYHKDESFGRARNMSRGNSLSDEFEITSVLGA